jgi:hypothetical protein
MAAYLGDVWRPTVAMVACFDDCGVLWVTVAWLPAACLGDPTVPIMTRIGHGGVHRRLRRALDDCGVPAHGPCGQRILL